MKKTLSLLLAIIMLTSIAGMAFAQSLTVWCWDPNFNVYAMQEAEKIYQKDHPDFKLNIVDSQWMDIQTKITTAASGDTSSLPDIFLMQDNAFQKNVISFPQLFVDLTNCGTNFADFAPAKVAYSVVDGKNYAIPFDSGAAIQVVRTDVLEKAGFTLADVTGIDWDRYIEIGKVVKEKTGVNMLAYSAGAADPIMVMLQSAGASLFNEDGTPNIANNDVLKAAFGVYTKMIKEGVLVESNGWDGYCTAMVSGTSSGTIEGCWILGTVQTATDLSGKWAVTNIPKLPGIESATNYSNNGGSSWGVTVNCKNQELAFDFLNKTFGSSKEFYDTILEKAGAISTYLPAGNSEVYSKPQEFFNGQKVYEDIVGFAGKIPSNITGVYYYEGSDAIREALSQVIGGRDINEALKEAQENVEFNMGI